jgi:hypothetical protein
MTPPTPTMPPVPRLPAGPPHDCIAQLSVDKAIHGLCPLDRPQATPRVSWVDGPRILRGLSVDKGRNSQISRNAVSTAVAMAQFSSVTGRASML